MRKVVPYQYAPTLESVWKFNQLKEERRQAKFAKLRPSIFESDVQNISHACYCENCSIEKTKFSFCCLSFWINENCLTVVGREAFVKVKEQLELTCHPNCCLTKCATFKKKYLDPYVS